MRWHLANRLVVLKIIAKFIAVFFFPLGHFAFEQSVLPQPFAHLANQTRVLRPKLCKYVACAVETDLRFGESSIHIREFRSLKQGH